MPYALPLISRWRRRLRRTLLPKWKERERQSVRVRKETLSDFQRDSKPRKTRFTPGKINCKINGGEVCRILADTFV